MAIWYEEPAHVQGGAGQRRPAERRADERYPCAKAAFCFSPTAPGRLWAQVRELSTTGVGLVLDREVKPNSRLVIELRRDPASAPLPRPARVVYAIRQARDRWVVGCEFDARLSEHLLRTLL